MSGTIYNRLFNTRLVHPFYESGFSNSDFAVRPTTETQEIFKNKKLVFKTDNTGFVVFFKADESGNALFPIASERLVFELELKNKSTFLNYTNLNAGLKTFTKNKVLYFTNKGTETSNDLSYDLLDGIKPKVFNFEFPQTAASGTDVGKIIITDSSGTIVTPTGPSAPASDNIACDNNDRFFYPVDLHLLKEGVYNFETRVNNTNAKTTTLYLNDELAKKDLFGIIDVFVINNADSSFPDNISSSVPTITTSRVYDAKFSTRNTQWKYYILLKSGSYTSGQNIGIVDGGGSQAPYNTTALSFNSSTATTINGINTKVITSVRTDIPFYEVPKKQLKLVLNPGVSQTTIIDNIPGPPHTVASSPPGNSGITEIYIYI